MYIKIVIIAYNARAAGLGLLLVGAAFVAPLLRGRLQQARPLPRPVSGFHACGGI